MPESMRWRHLTRFRQRSLPELNNLRRAERAGLTVPPTWWLWASEARNQWEAAPPAELASGPLIIRSCAPTGDTQQTSNAGQLLSLQVLERWEFPGALRRVVDALPRTISGVPCGAVFIQPLIEADEAGVIFFDGFYYECASAPGSNIDLTHGLARSLQRDGHLQRGERWSAWLRVIYATFWT